MSLSPLRTDLTPFERSALTVALTRLLDPNRYFSICDFDKMCQVAGVTPTHRDRQSLALLHCVEWRAMDKATRDGAISVILGTFGGEGVTWPTEEPKVETPPRAGFFRLLSRAGS